jgi:hypothetical protein
MNPHRPFVQSPLVVLIVGGVMAFGSRPTKIHYAARRNPTMSTRQKTLMKRISIVLLGLTPFISLHQANAQTTPNASTTAVKATTMTCTVSADEKRIVTANDDKSWTVANPKVLKGHAGDYVSITAEFDASKNRATVKAVKVLDTSAANNPKTLNEKDNDTPLVR